MTWGPGQQVDARVGRRSEARRDVARWPRRPASRSSGRRRTRRDVLRREQLVRHRAARLEQRPFAERVRERRRRRRPAPFRRARRHRGGTAAASRRARQPRMPLDVRPHPVVVAAVACRFPRAGRGRGFHNDLGPVGRHGRDRFIGACEHRRDDLDAVGREVEQVALVGVPADHLDRVDEPRDVGGPDAGTRRTRRGSPTSSGGPRRRSGPSRRTGRPRLPLRRRCRGVERRDQQPVVGVEVGVRRGRSRTRRSADGARGSHPEHAEARLRDRGVERRVEAHREDAAGVERVDDAVVPESGGGEVRRAFALVGLEDRRLEGVAFLVGRERRRGPWTGRAPPGGRPSREIRAFGHVHRNRGW